MVFSKIQINTESVTVCFPTATTFKDNFGHSFAKNENSEINSIFSRGPFLLTRGLVGRVRTPAPLGPLLLFLNDHSLDICKNTRAHSCSVMNTTLDYNWVIKLQGIFHVLSQHYI